MKLAKLALDEHIVHLFINEDASKSFLKKNYTILLPSLFT
jgi:hypothetical protein